MAGVGAGLAGVGAGLGAPVGTALPLAAEGLCGALAVGGLARGEASVGAALGALAFGPVGLPAGAGSGLALAGWGAAFLSGAFTGLATGFGVDDWVAGLAMPLSVATLVSN